MLIGQPAHRSICCRLIQVTSMSANGQRNMLRGSRRHCVARVAIWGCRVEIVATDSTADGSSTSRRIVFSPNTIRKTQGSSRRREIKTRWAVYSRHDQASQGGMPLHTSSPSETNQAVTHSVLNVCRIAGRDGAGGRCPTLDAALERCIGHLCWMLGQVGQRDAQLQTAP